MLDKRAESISCALVSKCQHQALRRRTTAHRPIGAVRPYFAVILVIQDGHFEPKTVELEAKAVFLEPRWSFWLVSCCF